MLLCKYNLRAHTTTLMKPFAAIKNLIPSDNNVKPAKRQVGDYVRVPDKRNNYSKGYTTNRNKERLKLQKINKRVPLLIFSRRKHISNRRRIK